MNQQQKRSCKIGLYLFQQAGFSILDSFDQHGQLKSINTGAANRASRCHTARLSRDGHAASGPLQSKVMCLLEFPVRSHLKAKALTLSSVALP